MSLEDVKSFATIAGVTISAFALLKGMIEYKHQGSQKRAENFITMRKRFKENQAFVELCNLLEDDAEKLAVMPFKEKRDFLGFFEEIAIMVNSGLIRKEVAHYMFGYYVIDCWGSENFWKNIDRESNFLALFKDFALEMKAVEE